MPIKPVLARIECARVAPLPTGGGGAGLPSHHESGGGVSRRVDTGTRARPRVLVVDDDEDIREIHAWALRAAGWIVETVANGHEALMTGPAFGPDVIVMDLKLPVLDGVRTMQIMKRDPRLAAVPVLVCTSYEELRTEATHAGCDAFLTKPVDPDEFRQVLEGLASTTRSSPPRPPV